MIQTKYTKNWRKAMIYMLNYIEMSTFMKWMIRFIFKCHLQMFKNIPSAVSYNQPLAHLTQMIFETRAKYQIFGLDYDQSINAHCCFIFLAHFSYSSFQIMFWNLFKTCANSFVSLLLFLLNIIRQAIKHYFNFYNWICLL